MTKLLGFQIADKNGNNIQGDDGDPSGLPSYQILSAQEAEAVLGNTDDRYLLQPIYEGDIEEPELPSEEVPTSRNQVFLVAWCGGYDAPSYALKFTKDSAWDQAREWLNDLQDGDTIDVLRLGLTDGIVSRLEAATQPR